MNWILKSGVDSEEVKRKGAWFKAKGDRLGFARYLHTVIFGDYISTNVIYCMVGENFDCGDNTVIGGSGFGFVKDDDGTWLEIPHVGRVIIGNNVRIGSNCCIDRGTIEDTVIGDGTKIDNMVHIAHNCKIGKNCIICAGVTFCGSVTVEDDVWLAPGTLIKEGLTIGKGAKTGLGAVVVEDVPPGALVYGVPARVKEVKVSIIMPVYKQRKEWFYEAIDSLCQQTYEDKEIIVSGITGDPAMDWAKNFNVKIVDSRIPDPKRQINEAIKFAEGEVVIQAGSDNVMLHDGLRKMVEVYEKNNAVMVYPDTEYCDEEMNMVYVHYAPKVFDMDLLMRRQIMSDCSLVSKAVLWEFGHFDITLSKFAVWDMWLKIATKYPDKIFHSGCVLWRYRRHNNSLGRVGHGEEFRERFYDKWNIEYRYKTLPPSSNALVING